jgi:hypothetical protein
LSKYWRLHQEIELILHLGSTYFFSEDSPKLRIETE